MWLKVSILFWKLCLEFSEPFKSSDQVFVGKISGKISSIVLFHNCLPSSTSILWISVFLPIVIIPILNNSNRQVFIGLIPSVPQPLWFHLIISISLNFFFISLLIHIRFQQQPCSPWIHLLRCFSLNTRLSFDAKHECVRAHTPTILYCGSDLRGPQHVATWSSASGPRQRLRLGRSD